VLISSGNENLPALDGIMGRARGAAGTGEAAAVGG